MKAEVDITGLDRTSIFLVIRGYYRLGYDSLKLRFNNPNTKYQRIGNYVSVISVIHTEVNRLIGYEVVHEGKNMCIIDDLQDVSTKDFDRILRRLFLLVEGVSRDLYEGAKNNDVVLLSTIEEKHDTITKFASYCLRLLNKTQYPVARTTPYYFHIISYLDRITDVIKYAARNLLTYNKELDKEVIEILEIVYLDIRLYHLLFYKYEYKKILEMNDHRYFTEHRINNLPETLKPMEIVVSTRVFGILELLLDLIEARSALEKFIGSS